MRVNVYTGDDDEDRCADGKANAFALAEFDLSGVRGGVGLALVCGLAGDGENTLGRSKDCVGEEGAARGAGA